MASTKPLNAANLERLGAARLATLLIEVATGDAGIKRRLRLALAGEAGADEAAHAIGKRLGTIAKSRSRIDWRKVKGVAGDLAAQHRAIVDLVAPRDPGAALDLLWRFVACAGPVYARSNDGSGRLAEVFDAATASLGPVAIAARIAPAALAERLFDAIRDDDGDMHDALVDALAPALGTAGLEQLRTLVLAWQGEAAAVPSRTRPGSGGRGSFHPDQVEARRRERVGRPLLRRLADALGDVDGYVAQHDAAARRSPMVAARIATRLLAADRADEALAVIEGAAGGDTGPAVEWEQARLAVLEALGRHDEAQDYRRERFAATLDADHLRGFLKRLPDFEDFDAEQRALADARGHPDVHRALGFLIGWPALDRAAALVMARAGEIDGDDYGVLTPAAEALEAKYPLAATVLLRAMIGFSLNAARPSRYGHAARHLASCAHLARRIDDWGTLPPHDRHVAALRTAHGRKAGFWSAVDAG